MLKQKTVILYKDKTHSKLCFQFKKKYKKAETKTSKAIEITVKYLR
jgi:hypothetical protein